MSESLTFGVFLRRFWPNVGALMSGALSVPLTIAAIYFPNAPLKALFACLAGFSVVLACYRVWRDSVSALQRTIAARDAEIEKLAHRPYDEEHRRLAEQKLNSLPDFSQDLIYFLLHHGEIENGELQKRCQNPSIYNEALARARNEKLILDLPRQKVGRAGVDYFWKVNPEFQIILQDLLGKRDTRYFL